MIELQKKYARDLLTHVNPYTKTAYTDEPAIALVEISNEERPVCGVELGAVGLSARSLRHHSPQAVERLAEIKIRQYRKTPPGVEPGRHGDARQGDAQGRRFLAAARPGWQVERDDQTKADVSIQPSNPNDGRRVLRVAATASGRAHWNPLLVQNGLTVKKGAIYTLTCRMRSDSVQQCEVACQMAHAPWESLGLSTSIEAGPQWQEYRLTFIADRDEANARINFGRFQHGGAYELANVSLRPGGIVGLGPNGPVGRRHSADGPSILPAHAGCQRFLRFPWRHGTRLLAGHVSLPEGRLARSLPGFRHAAWL